MTYLVAVRALCEFTARRGDLDLRFTPAPTAQEGIAGHALVAARRGPAYQTEVSLAGEFRSADEVSSHTGHLQVRGRADGFDPTLVQLEEVKTYRGDFENIKANQRTLHWAQLKVYGWLMCQAQGLSEIRLALVYFQIDRQDETLLLETHSAADLKAFFELQCRQFLAWAVQEQAHRQQRDERLATLAFPHPDFRPGQRELAEAVYRSAAKGRCLLAEAPTGIGKTVGTLFPLLKAVSSQQLDKLFFLTAKTSGRQMALKALALLQTPQQAPQESQPPASTAVDIDPAHAPAKPLRVLEMVARDKACEYPDRACHGDACPLAKGFYDRLPQARSAALTHGWMDQASVRQTALAQQVCPYYLSQELARWADVVVGDYNYFFDSSALLHALTQEQGWRVSVLVDEAHNMVERARQMYSATLDQTDLQALRRRVPGALKKDLDRLQRAWQVLHRDQDKDYAVYPELPPKFMGALQQAVATLSAHMAEHPADVDADLQRFCFDALHFQRMADVFGQHSLFDVTLHTGAASGSRLYLRNVLPAPFLAPRFAATHCSALFSATLSPWDYYTDLLGMPDNTACIEVASPFAAEQLQVKVMRRMSTRYAHRSQSLAPMVAVMAQQYAAQPGKYLAFFSSFDYLQQALALFEAQHPNVPVWQQKPRMDEAGRRAFLARFTQGNEGSASEEAGGHGIGFAVLGGLFGEGIDLPGKQLIGAFIATQGLPQVNPVNEQIMQRMATLFGDGYSYTYLYPGLRKVVQAAGRVIRTTTDQGVIYLMDDRFARTEVQALLPSWWQIELAD